VFGKQYFAGIGQVDWQLILQQPGRPKERMPAIAGLASKQAQK
jgi:hypothetical protein